MGSEVLLRLSIAKAQALTWLTEASSKDQARPTLCSLSLEWKVDSDGTLELTAAATDSYMLGVRVMTFPKGTFEALPEEGSILVQAKPFADALKSTVKVGNGIYTSNPEMQDTIIQIEDSGVTVASADGSEFKVVKTVDAEFPKWRQLLSKEPVTKFDLADMKQAGDSRTANEKREDFYFQLPAVSPALMVRMSKLVAQPPSKLSNGGPLRWAVSQIHNAHLKPSLFTMPQGSEQDGDLTILVMPVRI